MMDDKPHIRLVNPHPKRNGRNDNLYPIFHPMHLDIAFLALANVRVVEGYFKILSLKLTTHLFAVFSGDAVDYAGLVFVA